MTSRMALHDRPARRRPPSVKEFWIATGIKIWNNLQRSRNMESSLAEAEAASKRLEGKLVSRDRGQMLQAAFAFQDDEWPSVISHLTCQWCEIINPGTLIVVDETILASESKQAYHEGKLKFIEGKPHPKGYFFNGALQRFRYSACVFILDVEYKLGFNSNSMGEALETLIERCEKRFSAKFLVLADSGYPASSFLLSPQITIKSNFIASVSVAKVSGKLRKIPEAFGLCGRVGARWILSNPQLGLFAYVAKSKEYTQCLVTNYCLPIDHVPSTVKLSYNQAFALASNFRVSELATLLKFPQPAEYSDMAIHTWLFIEHHFGVDLASPVDSSGYVTKASLSKLDLPSLKMIASTLNLQQKVGMKKEQYIKRILASHPRALPEEMGPAISTPKKDHTEQSASQLQKSVNMEHRTLKTKLLTSANSKPEWAQTYSESYGWQDRFNGMIYESLDQSSSPTPAKKLAWLAIFAPLINAYGYWCELSLSKLPNADAKVRAAKKLPHLRLFICNLVCQLADWVDTMDDNHPPRLSRRSSRT